MVSQKFSTNAEEIKIKHPQLFEAVKELIASDPMKYANLKANFSGKHSGRRVSYGKLFDALEQDGYEIKINVTLN